MTSRYFPFNPERERIIREILAHRWHRPLDKFRKALFNDLVDAFNQVQADIDNITDISEYDCDASLLEAQCVYVDAEDHVAPAIASPTGTPAFGVVLSKPSPTRARVVTNGPVPNFVGLVPGEEYFLSMIVPGGVANPPPPTGPPNSFVQYIGRAVTETVLEVDPVDGPIYF